jgi:DNA-binding MarR family transcriptional regulator
MSRGCRRARCSPAGGGRRQPRRQGRQGNDAVATHRAHFISAQAPVTLIDLTHALGTGPPATSAMVDRLTSTGLVCSAPDPQDRRVQLTITARAEAIVGDIDLDTARRLQMVLNGMSPQARRRLIDVLRDTVRCAGQPKGSPSAPVTSSLLAAFTERFIRNGQRGRHCSVRNNEAYAKPLENMIKN